MSGEAQNVFDENDKRKVPVKVIVDGQELTVGQAQLVPGADGIVHVDMDLKTDDPNDIIGLFGNGITGYSMAVEPDLEAPKHRMGDDERQQRAGVKPHNHKPKQHRDMKPAWCNECLLTEDYQIPKKNFGFGTPANPLRRDAR